MIPPPPPLVTQIAAAIEDPGSPSPQLVAVARAFADAAQAPLVLLHHAAIGADHAAARRDLQRAARGIDPEGSVGSVMLRGEQTAPALVEYSREHPGALLVLATQARRAPGRLLWGSVAVEVARRAPGPLVLIGPACDAATSLGELIVCVDPDGAARAEPVAEALGTSLSLATREVIVSGTEVAGEILSHAERSPAGVLLMSTQARRSGRRFRSGSVVVDVLARATRPVVVVGPECQVPSAPVGG